MLRRRDPNVSGRSAVVTVLVSPVVEKSGLNYPQPFTSQKNLAEFAWPLSTQKPD